MLPLPTGAGAGCGQEPEAPSGSPVWMVEAQLQPSLLPPRHVSRSWVGSRVAETGIGHCTPAAGVPCGFAYCTVPASLVIYPPQTGTHLLALDWTEGSCVLCHGTHSCSETRTGRRKGGEGFARLRGGLERKWGARPASLGTPQLGLADSALEPGGSAFSRRPLGPESLLRLPGASEKTGGVGETPETLHRAPWSGPILGFPVKAQGAP